MKRKVKTGLAVLLLLLLALLVGWAWQVAGGAEHDRTRKVVCAKTSALQRQIDQRCDALDAKLDRIEAKLDRLLELAAPALPDAMRTAD